MSIRELSNKADDLDSVLKEIGGCSHFQIRRHILFFLMTIPFACQNLLMVFAGHNPGICEQKNSTNCTAGKSHSAECPMKNHHTFYKDTSFSIVTEFDLVCERSYLNQIANSVFFIGAVLGSILIGWITDRFGRKAVLFGCFAIVIVISGLSAFLKPLWFFIMARFLIGFFLSGFAVALYVIASEIVSPAYRSFSTTSLWNYFSVGLMILALKAYYIQNWRNLQLITTMPYLVFFLFYKWTPESLRWLWSTGQYKQANESMKTIAKENKREEGLQRVSDNLKVENNGSVYCNYMHIFKNRKLLIYTCVLSFLSLATAFIYYGFFLVSDSLSGDVYLDFALLAAMEIPANFLSIYCTGRFGRKKTVITGFAISCLSSGVLFYTIKAGIADRRYINIGVGMVGKMFVSIALASGYVWTCELYPTIARSKGLGLVTSIRLIGGAGAPWITSYIMETNPELPFVVITILAGLAAILCFVLPETRRVTTIETFKDLHESSNVRQQQEQNNMTELKYDNKNPTIDETATV